MCVRILRGYSGGEISLEGRELLSLIVKKMDLEQNENYQNG